MLRLSSSPLTTLHHSSLSCFPIQVGKKTIINKLFFDLAQEEESVLDAEFLKVHRIYLLLLNSKPSGSLPFYLEKVPRVSGAIKVQASDLETVIRGLQCKRRGPID